MIVAVEGLGANTGTSSGPDGAVFTRLWCAPGTGGGLADVTLPLVGVGAAARILLKREQRRAES